MEPYLPQADKWIEKHKAIEADASRSRSQGYRRHITYRNKRHTKRHKRYTRRSHKHHRR